MNEAQDKNGLGAVFDLAAGLLKNPAVIEGIITGISALTASQRVKNPKSEKDGFDLGGIFEMLPSVLPLLSLFKTSASDQSIGESVSAMASVSDSVDDADPAEISEISFDSDDSGSETDACDSVSVGIFDRPENSITYGTKQEQRENLLLAIRPFLSESRVAAADAMMQINRVSGIFRA